LPPNPAGSLTAREICALGDSEFTLPWLMIAKLFTAVLLSLVLVSPY